MTSTTNSIFSLITVSFFISSCTHRNGRPAIECAEASMVFKYTDIPAYEISSNLSEQVALDRLLNSSRYDPRTAPPSDEAVAVDISILLLTVASPDESSLKYEIDFLLNMQWTDNRLRYRIVHDHGEEEETFENNREGGSHSFHHRHHSTYQEKQQQLFREYSILDYPALPLRLEKFKKKFLDGLHHSENVWLPDIYFVKHGDFRAHIEPKHLALRISPSGKIYFTTRKYLILSCSGDPPVFPFDVANCSFSLESVSLEEDRLVFRWLGEQKYLKASHMLRKLNTYFVSNKTDYCPQSTHGRGKYSCLNLELIFSRDRAYYFTTVFIPGIILVTSSFITFWLEWNAVAARIMLGVTTMLNFFITSNRFRVTLPVVSELHAMNIWEAFSMVFIYSALLEFIIVNYVGRKRPRISTPAADNEPKADEGIEDTLPANPENPDGQDNENNETGKKSPNILNMHIQVLHERMFANPIKTAKTIDVISRIIFPVAYLIVLIFFFVKFLGVFH